MNKNFIVGIDEVGRGPLAGPMYICVFGYFENEEKNLKKILENIDDSKKISEKKREVFFEKISELKKEKKVFAEIFSCSALEIDKFGLSKCLKKMIEKGLEKILKDADLPSANPPQNFQIFLDGSLKAPEKYQNQKTIIGGDGKIFSISCASVTAKVKRDEYMKKITKNFPEYKFEKNKGYGTKEHRKAIAKIGISKIHRKTFCKKFV